MNRYVRQIAVSAFGAAGQARAARGRVLVVGAGGLAAPVLQYLGGAGIGTIRLVDPDRVDVTNLHRQTLFREADLGQPKAEIAAAHVRALNSECRIDPVVAALDPDNAAAFCGGTDLVLDCADSFAASYILSDTCRALGLPLVSASVLGLDGYVGGFCGGAPSLRAVFPDLPRRAGTCAEAGVLGPVVGLVGAIQAQMALAIITELAPSPLGQLITVDAGRFRFGGFRFDGAPEPERQPRFVAPSAIRDSDFLVDLRAENEAPLVRPGAHRLSVVAFGPDGPRPASGQRAIFLCRTGLRSWQAAERLGAVWDGDIALVALGDPQGESA